MILIRALEKALNDRTQINEQMSDGNLKREKLRLAGLDIFEKE